MAPNPRAFTDTTENASNSSPVTPEVIAGIVFACAILLGVSLWFGIRYYRKRNSQPNDIIVRGVLSEADEKAMWVSLFCDAPMFLSSIMTLDFPLR